MCVFFYLQFFYSIRKDFLLQFLVLLEKLNMHFSLNSFEMFHRFNWQNITDVSKDRSAFHALGNIFRVSKTYQSRRVQAFITWLSR
jgi:hypothetical protein